MFPENQIAYVGSSVYITCHSFYKPKWSKNGTPLHKGSVVMKSLQISDVQESDSGSYICEGVHNDGNRTAFKSQSELYVGGMP